ncbi:hypothetical protein OIC43_11450 [Streptomyces sp. NBC_00825]|uniref:hypothetical protein n=1 Tax=unclassified Streptomyces TaxID=2593676 RepID=UPI002258AF78|nr:MULTISPECIES: hypothetical protein [unclassified Streptomyces]WTB57503.1 hypothetical protein OG832_32245 [Streptomyces sp. NBC_00826]WTH89615.1 hypothetical protein OIC43_11450 [Streptomyces sp. NBC_00825]WTH98342.1 hypothetical protein OHA23_11435 [Streptomyces sp. NBC_00822]MCX4863704.1 hypothetical protein [Streptomyces sp. NBC_00906]MCX4894942.1 hypothetical protein [Streptomyces sp. NBC_00892]
MDERREETYCGASTAATAGTGTEIAAGPPYAECVLCRKPTEYPESVKGITLCPVCEWQEAQRTACSG